MLGRELESSLLRPVEAGRHEFLSSSWRTTKALLAKEVAARNAIQWSPDNRGRLSRNNEFFERDDVVEIVGAGTKAISDFVTKRY